MRRYLLSIILLLLATNLFAGGEQNLVVLLKSGTRIVLPVSEQPKITFDGTVMRVGDGDYQIGNVRKWMVGDPEQLSVDDVKANSTIAYKEGVLTVSSGTDIRVYNAAGVEMPISVRSDGNGRLHIDLSALPQDVYVVKVDNETLKLRKP